MTADANLKPQGPRGISYDKPTLIKAADAPRFLWGDPAARYVSDWIYGSSPKIHMMSFEMDVGARFEIRQTSRPTTIAQRPIIA